jgi:serine/threonine-protein kinase HipA
MSDVSPLVVRLNGNRVGTLINVGGDRTIFAFEDSHIQNSDRPTLGLAFKDEFGGLRTEFRPYQTRVMPFFSNLLPEGPLRSYLAMRAGVHENREFLLLKALGEDLPGAVTLSVADDGSGALDVPTFEDHNADSTASDPALRFSLAGVQLKFSAVAGASGGLTIPATGAGGNWIVKLPSPQFDNVPENELSMMHLAGLVGIDVPEIKLVDIADIDGLPDGSDRFGARAFVIKRFDRADDGTRVHIEDFAQVYGVYPERKYEKASMRNLLQVLTAEGTEADVTEFIHRLTFNTLIGNGDMHLKNWSLIYRDQRTASLSPAYDFVSTIAYIPGDKAALIVSRSKAFADFTVDELSHLAVKSGIPKKMVLDTARETVGRFLSHWTSEKSHLPMDAKVRHAIDRHLEGLPILRELG